MTDQVQNNSGGLDTLSVQVDWGGGI